ncbi:Ig-like domain-containing protein, partial [Leclercia pneumoniae]
NLTAAAVDAAGNLSATSPAVTVTIDTLAPSVPQIDAVEGATLVGDILYSRDSTPTITGTGEPGSRITVTIDGTALESSPTVQPDGTWSITLPGNLALSDAAHTIEIVATDPAGNTTSGEPISLTVDTTPPGAPEVTDLAPEGTPLTGTAEAGSTVVITGPGNVELGRGVADAQGNFSIALSPAQTSATTLTLIATDAAGNPGASTDYTVIDSGVDLPDVPVITTIIDGEGAVTGDVKGKTSDDPTPTLNGTAPANSTVNIFLDGNPVAVATVTAGPDGTWTWPVAPALTEGAHSFAVSATQDGATSGLSPAASVTIDVTAPNAPVIGAVTDDIAPGTGPLTSGQTTNDAQPTLSGRGTPGETITVYDNDTPIGTALVGATGSWTFTPTEALGEGNHSLTITATDPAGNESDPSAAFTLVVDTVSLTPTITNVSDNVDPVQGTIPTNGVTNDNTPTLTGTAEPNSVVTISDGNTVLGTAIANASGTWTFTPTLAEGTHNFTVIATDPQGNVSDASTPWTVVVDTTAPTLPVITSVSDNVEGGTGNLTNGQLTNDSTPTLTGTGEEGSTVRILDGNTVIGSVVVGEGGTWSFTPEPALTNGPHSLRVNAIDPAGNVSANSPVFTITVDITPPAAPAITSVVDDVGPATGTLASGASTNDNLPTFNGTGEVGATIQIFDNDALIGTAVVSAAGTWTFTPTTALTDGPHVFSLSAVDAAGNTSVTSTLYNLTVDTAAPNTPTLLSVTDDQGPNTGTLTSGQATNDQQPTLAGTAEAGAIVRILDNGVQIGETTAGSDGRWTFSPDSALSNGSHTLTITATDAAGNVSTPTQGFVVVVDNVPPQAPLISQAIDDQGSITGPVGSGQPTNDAQPVLNGTSEPNAVVRVFEG